MFGPSCKSLNISRSASAIIRLGFTARILYVCAYFNSTIKTDMHVCVLHAGKQSDHALCVVVTGIRT
uniref:Uncharacterized protein n=1 Tax=Physcomitrium patens TaxID=3218 RepID=A0A2K1L8I7_PHYPA|nr:hypothetical protein PHYPA_000738 [Physcomitrium patens]